MLAVWLVAACGDNVPPPASSTFTADEAARICATLETCFHLEWGAVWGGSMYDCTTAGAAIAAPGGLQPSPLAIDGFGGPLTDLYRCILTVDGDCAAAGRCLALDGPAGSCAPTAGLENGVCNGTMLSGCTDDGYAFGVDCARYGEICGQYSFFFNTYNACLLGACASPNGECIGSIAKGCTQASLISFEIDCARAFGGSCELNTHGFPTCVGGGPACSPGTKPSCDGNVISGCDANGRAIQYDCAAMATQRRCDDQHGCVPTGDECGEEDAPEWCDGASLVFCQDGFVREVDCRSIGFSGCAIDRCVP